MGKDWCWVSEPRHLAYVMEYELWSSYYEKKAILYDGTGYYFDCIHDRIRDVYECCHVSKEEALKQIVEQVVEYNGVRIHYPIYDESLIEVLNAIAKALKERRDRGGEEYYPFLALLVVADLTGATTVKDILDGSAILLKKGTYEDVESGRARE